MHVVGLGISKRQLIRLKKGEQVRVRHGEGFNVIVHPETYNLMSRAFGKDKGVQIKLSPDEIDLNNVLSPEQHSSIPKEDMEQAVGSGLYAGAEGRGMYAGNIFKGKDWQEKSNKSSLTQAVKGGNIFKGKDWQEKSNKSSLTQAVKGMSGGKFMGMESLRIQNEGTAKANASTAGMDKKFVDGLRNAQPVKSYWDEPGAPPSRGTGLKHRLHDDNLIRGKHSLISQDHGLPPALQEQPYGANYHMRNMLPPQYQKYNSGV